MMRIRRPDLMFACALVLGLFGLPAQAALDGKHSSDVGLFSESEYRRHLTHLASDELEGRGTGQVGNDQAADYIAEVFKECGVQPAGDNGTYFQSFTLQLKSNIGAGTRLAVGTDGRRVRRPVRLNEEFIPLPFSSKGTFKGDVVFAGYGIVTDDYNDYQDIDVADKVVLVLRRAPDFGEFGIRDSSFRAKASRANARDAAALIIVNHDGDETLYDFQAGSGRGGFVPRSYGIPMLHVTPETADKMLSAAGLPGIRALQERIEEGRRPVSAVLKGVTVRGAVNLEPTDTPVRNVVGLIPGRGPKADEMIVLGAHYDHLGIRNKGEPEFDPEKDISNGADDNASGTSLLMTIADAYTRGPGPQRSLLLAAFTGEELGLLGSRHFVKNPTVDLSKCIAMLNFDMIGRLKNDHLEIGGMKTGGFEDVVRSIAPEYGLKISDGGGGRGPSDHSSFYGEDIPVLFFFTGIHRQYHRPEDDSPLINYEGAMRVARFAADIIDDIDAEADRPKFAPDQRRAIVARQGEQEDAEKPTPPAERVRLGIRPDVDDRPGVLVAGVSEDSPAQRAGFEGGDRIIRIGDEEIADVAELLNALTGLTSSEKTTIQVLRRGERVRLAVSFGPTEQAVAEGGPANRVQLGVVPEMDDEPGVLVAEIRDDTPASRSDLKVGDRIVGIGQTKVNRLEDAVRALERFGGGDAAILRVVRGEKKREVAVRFSRAPAPSSTVGKTDPVLERIERRIKAQLEDRRLSRVLGLRSTSELVCRSSSDCGETSLDFRIEIGEAENYGRLVDSLIKTIDEVIDSDRKTFRVTVESHIKLGDDEKFKANVVVHVERALAAAVATAERVRGASPGAAKKAKVDAAHAPTADEDSDMPSMPPVRLGIMPSYGPSEGEGFEISGVVEGGAAAQAGMQDKDRIFKIGTHKVTDVYTYMDALRSHKPGEVITVIVIRNGRKVELKVKAQAPKSTEPA